MTAQSLWGQSSPQASSRRLEMGLVSSPRVLILLILDTLKSSDLRE